MNQKINQFVAELVGLHSGDGTLYLTNRSIVWELRGSLEEKEFYQKYLKSLLYKIFKTNFEPKFRSGGKNGCFGFQITKKEVVYKLLNCGFNVGRKSNTLRIPSYIFEEDDEIKRAYIRGLFDTDGCFRFEMINKKPYPKIEFCSASLELINDLNFLLKHLGFRTYIWGKKYYKLGIAGHLQINKFLFEIRPSNTKHLKRVEHFRLVLSAAVA